jgi:hypothetical protein
MPEYALRLRRYDPQSGNGAYAALSLPAGVPTLC